MAVTVPIWVVWIAKAIGVGLAFIVAFYVLALAFIGYALVRSFSKR